MNFKAIIELLYIDRGYSNNQALFLRELLLSSVNKPDKINIADATLKGYFYGNNITSLAPMLIKAELNVDKLSAYIDSLYDTKHKNTPTYQKRFLDKSYKEALFEKAKKYFPDITFNNMSKRLADTFYTIVNNTYAEIVAKDMDKSSNTETHVEDTYNRLIVSYTITETDKRAIKNLCKLINNSLFSIEHQTTEISDKQFDLKKLTNFEKEAKWKAFLESDITLLKKRFDDSYSELKKWCDKAVELLEPKRHLDPCLEIIYNIADGIDSNKYKITCPAEFDYSSFSVMISDFKKSYKLLLRCIDKL